MALVLKRIYEGYFWLTNDLADPRVAGYFLMGSPIPMFIILYVWLRFVTKWGPNYMKDKEPFDPKRIMILYNIAQVVTNGYIFYDIISCRNELDWRCGEVDYSNSYWGLKFLNLGYLYSLLKITDLIDTVFFVLRKKQGHVSFLHTYHHCGMVILTWIGMKFVAGGHSYFLLLANTPVHMILYCYYLLTAYDNKYGKLLWLKKLITQVQLIQFAFLVYKFGQTLFIPNCNYPRLVAFIVLQQNLFMMILFMNFYVRTYILEPRRKRRVAEQAEAAKKGKL